MVELGNPGNAGFVNVGELQRTVEQRFSVYDVQYDDNVIAFFVTVDEGTLESDFNSLKNELKEQGLIPLLKYQGGEHSIYVVHKPHRNYRSERVNLVLFILTWITTTLAGVSAWFYYAHGNLDPGALTSAEYFATLYAPRNWVWGFLTFALPLMTILGVHEMGHYVLTRKHGMEASLPFFIPLPPLMAVNIGTLGAFISMREPIPSKKALLDIGVAGPIAGFIVSIPVLLIGMVMMKINPVVADPVGSIELGTPLLYDLLAMPFGFSENQLIHPTAFAGWVGLFVTAINLLPAGQLDGGHVAAALMGEKARYLSYGAVAILVLLGLVGVPPLGVAPFQSWLIFALLITFIGVNHPPTLNGVSDLDGRRRVVGAVTFALFFLCFTPTPITL